MYLYCDNEKLNKLAETNIITIRIYLYLMNKCKNAEYNRVRFTYRELQDILGIGHTSIARSVKTLKELGFINKIEGTGGTPEYEIPAGTTGMVNFNFVFKNE